MCLYPLREFCEVRVVIKVKHASSGSYASRPCTDPHHHHHHLQVCVSLGVFLLPHQACVTSSILSYLPNVITTLTFPIKSDNGRSLPDESRQDGSVEFFQFLNTSPFAFNHDTRPWRVLRGSPHALSWPRPRRLSCFHPLVCVNSMTQRELFWRLHMHE